MFLLLLIIIIRVLEYGNRLAATRFGILNRTSLIDFNIAGRCSGIRWWSNTILNFGRHSHESLLHIAGILGRCFKEWNAQIVGVFLHKNNQKKIISTHKYFSLCVCFFFFWNVKWMLRLPQPWYDRQLFLWSNQTCCRPTIYSHFRMHNARFPQAIA